MISGNIHGMLMLIAQNDIITYLILLNKSQKGRQKKITQQIMNDKNATTVTDLYC